MLKLSSEYSIFIYILLLAISVFIAWWTYNTSKSKERFGKYWKWLILLRALSFLSLLALLFSPYFYYKKNIVEKPTLLFVKDNSLSMTNFLSESENKIILKKIEQWFPELEDIYNIDTLQFGDTISHSWNLNQKASNTNFEILENYIKKKYSHKNLKHIFLISDANYNKGIKSFLDNTLETSINVLMVGDTTKFIDHKVNNIICPEIVNGENPFEIYAEFETNANTSEKTNAGLYIDNKLVSTKPINFESNSQLKSILFNISEKTEGNHEICIKIDAAKNEKNLVNNSICKNFEVSKNKLEIAILMNSPHPDAGTLIKSYSSLKNWNTKLYYQSNFINAKNSDLFILHNFNINTAPKEIINELKSKPFIIINGVYSQLAGLNDKFTNLTLSNFPKENTPILNNSFNYFEINDINKNLFSHLPPLVGNTKGIMATSNREVLFSNSQNQDLIYFYKGVKNAIIINGEGIWRWRLQIFKESGKFDDFDKIFRKMIDFLNVNSIKNQIRINSVTKHLQTNEPFTLMCEMYNETGDLTNSTTLNLKIDSKNFIMNKTSNAYQINTDNLGIGVHNFTLSGLLNGKNIVKSGSFIVDSTNLELSENTINTNYINDIVSTHSGKKVFKSNLEEELIYLKKADFKSMNIQEIKEKSLIDIKIYLFILILCQLLSYLLRKINGVI